MPALQLINQAARSLLVSTVATLFLCANAMVQTSQAGPMGSAGASGDIMGIAEREIARRQEAMNAARREIALGDQATREKDYEQAVGHYRKAFELLPEAQVSEGVREEALGKFCSASVRLAEQRITEGEYAKARAILEEALSPQFNPHYRPAIVLLAHLEDPDYFNQTITPQHAANVEQVKAWFVEADGLYRSGQFDKALERTEQILNIDPYNKAARRFQETIHNELMAYGRDAYNTQRARLLDELQREWAPPVNPFVGDRVGSLGPIQEQDAEQSGININNRKLESIILPKIEFRDATVREAVDFLKQESIRRDDTNLGGRKGINIVLDLSGAGSLPSSSPGSAGPGAPTIPGIDPAPATEAFDGGAGLSIDPNNVRITVELTNIPLREALKYVTSLGGLKFKVEPYAVLVVPLSSQVEDLITQRFRVPPTFLSTPLNATVTPGAEAASAATTELGSAPTPRSILESNGVSFPPGSSASYFPGTSQLVVKNTQANIDLIDEILRGLEIAKPRQITIASKFIEVTQSQLKELSFDWLMGEFNIGGSARTFGAGGTEGALRGASEAFGVNGTNFPFVDGGGNSIGSNLMTGGNRSGVGALGAITANAIDSLLSQTPAGLAPGVFSVAGVFTDPEFQLVIRALDQKKGVDLLSSPRVTTRSGQRAVIEIIREFRYPTEFEAPQIPQELNLGANAIAVVAPTTPTTFETRNTGVTLEVEPVVGPDGYTIDLNLIPQVVEFEGFINYGSPIRAGAAGVLTENVINQPIFSTRKVQTSVTIWDGQTVVLGGLMREDVQKVEDKVPLLGDIPLLGRAFRSSVDQSQKRNLIIFVTARLIDPAGQPILQPESMQAPVNGEEGPLDMGLSEMPDPMGMPLK